jgi:hypothetical protein
MKPIKPKVNLLIFRDSKKDKMEETIKRADEGCIPFILDIIMHNQAVLNYKLNKILIVNNKLHEPRRKKRRQRAIRRRPS